MERPNADIFAANELTDSVSLGFAGLLLALTVVFPSRVPDSLTTAVTLVVAGSLYAFVAKVLVKFVEERTASALHAVAVLLLSAFFFSIVSRFQHVFVDGWMDDVLIQWERSITGTEATHSLEHITNPELTEWMMFSYVLYVPLLPFVVYLCHRGGGCRGVADYMANLTLANVLCYAGFILFPVAGPLCHEPMQYTVPLQGGVFTWLGEWIRGNLHYPGGCLPSPHCAAATVMIAMLSRYNRRTLAILLPPLLTIYVATVYGRYHYAGDVVAGLLVAVLVLRFSPAAIMLLNRRSSGNPAVVQGIR